MLGNLVNFKRETTNISSKEIILERIEFEISKTKTDLDERKKENTAQITANKKTGYNPDYMGKFLRRNEKPLEQYIQDLYLFKNEISNLSKNSVLKLQDSQNNMLESNLKWNFSDSELIELITALHESGAVQTNKKENLINAFAELFNIDLKDFYQKQSSLLKRNNDNETICLDKLKNSFLTWYDKRLRKNNKG